MAQNHVTSNIQNISPIFEFIWFWLCKIEYWLRYGITSHIITNHHANLRPYPILPTAMPTTAYIRYYMISDQVKSNIWTPILHQQPHQAQCRLQPISDFTNCNANHCPYLILHDFGPCKIEYMNSVMTPTATPTAMPTSAHIRFYHLQCQSLPIFDITWFRTM